MYKVLKKNTDDRTNSLTAIFGNLKNRYAYVQLYRNNIYISSYTCKYDESLPADTICLGLHARTHHKLAFYAEVQCKFIGISDLVDQNDITIAVSPMSNNEKDIIFIHQEALIDALIAKKVLIANNKMLRYTVDGKDIILCINQNVPNTTCGFLKLGSKVTVLPSHSKIIVSDNNTNTINKDMFKDDFNFETIGIGGLDNQLVNIFKKALSTRAYPPPIIKKLGISHVKGIVLHGPPGTGKTLIARNISKLITKKEPKIVNGPEIFDKFVGGSEENIRNLFADAESDYAMLGENSPLHVIIFDEIDAICRHRGNKSDNTGTNDKVVNQLLTKIQGVDLIDNIFIIGLTNRLDLLDAALLRPGRLHPQIKIGLPDKKGREQVFRIHTKIMESNGFVEDTVSLSELAQYTHNYTGAEIESIVTAATSVALYRNINSAKNDQIIVTRDDFTKSIKEFVPAFGNENGKLGLIIKSMGHEPSRDLSDMFNLQYISQIDNATSLVTPCIFNPDVLIYLLNVCYFDVNTVKTISNSDLMGKSDGGKIDLITSAINECYQSNISTLLITDVDNLINYSELGTVIAYSNSILQTLISIIKSESPFGNRIKIYLVVSNSLIRNFLSKYVNMMHTKDDDENY